MPHPRSARRLYRRPLCLLAGLAESVRAVLRRARGRPRPLVTARWAACRCRATGSCAASRRAQPWSSPLWLRRWVSSLWPHPWAFRVCASAWWWPAWDPAFSIREARCWSARPMRRRPGARWESTISRATSVRRPSPPRSPCCCPSSPGGPWSACWPCSDLASRWPFWRWRLDGRPSSTSPRPTLVDGAAAPASPG